MQWLIDTIKELIHSQLGAFVRGDTPGNDFTILDFTIDNAWHGLDLSAIAPADAQMVNVIFNMRSTTINKRTLFRRKGITGSGQVIETRSQVANVFFTTSFAIPLNADRVCEYKVTSVDVNGMFLTVLGWWLR